MQWRMTRRNLENIYPVFIYAISASVALTILLYSGREDLASYALVAALLMSIGQMSFFVGSELLTGERRNQILELVTAAPTGYFWPLLIRITLLTCLGVVGFAVAWVIAAIGFQVRITVHHPGILVVTVLLTIAAAAVTALVTSTLYCFGRTPRTYQNAIPGPLYLLGGVLVPVEYLPEFIQPLSRIIFFYWSAELLRDSFTAGPAADVGSRLAAIALLGIVGGSIGAILLRRLLDHLRREGTLGL